MLDLAYLPAQPLYGATDAALPAIGWQLSPEPFALSKAQLAQLTQLGEILNRFVKAIDLLYRQSQNPNTAIPGWVAEWYDQGKPDDLLRFSNMKRFKSSLPLVLRPDLLLQEDGWSLCEIDAVPGGLGFISALNRLYRKNGFSVVEPANGLPGAFIEAMQALVPDVSEPVIAIVLSDEAGDYRSEMQWLVDTIREGSDLAPAYPNLHLLHPRDLNLVRDRLVFTDPANQEEKPIDLIYRFFELFDLPNIPKVELIQYAVKKGLVKCTPPFKPHVEEKLSLALLHHPVLAPFWEEHLGAAEFEQLRQWVPKGWVIDPSPSSPQSFIAGLTPGGKLIQRFEQLKGLSQKERELVLKPSGFSPLGWGSRGVTIGHDHAADSWAAKVDEALAQFGKTPYILQQFEASDVFPATRFQSVDSAELVQFQARVRLCPYYLVQSEQVKLSGILATVCPADKKLIHGMKDAVLLPCHTV